MSEKEFKLNEQEICKECYENNGWYTLKIVKTTDSSKATCPYCDGLTTLNEDDEYDIDDVEEIKCDKCGKTFKIQIVGRIMRYDIVSYICFPQT